MIDHFVQNLRLITFSSTLRCDQISNDEILLSTDPSQKQEVNRKAFAKFDKDHSGSRTATAAAESDPTVRYNGKVKRIIIDFWETAHLPLP